MSQLARYGLARAGLYVIENPKDIALAVLLSRYVPGGTQKLIQLGGATIRYKAAITPATARYALSASKILIGAGNVARIGAAATATKAAATTIGTLGSAAVIGYGIGAAVGTGAGYLIDGSRGANAARDLYTFQVSPKEYVTTVGGAIKQVLS
ncbi:MAG TPA: hypothetical protein D7H99_04675 [Candidatus Poseidoniales archaeon]|mgnify:CR=1 FL=1|nr:MAG TPA: hypothetical protein D7H99_04675 [Candidatus Poseidoniales archaeon]